MVVDYLDVVSVAATKLETNPPGAIDGHRPLIPAGSLELVQTDALEWTQIVQRLSDVEREQ